MRIGIGIGDIAGAPADPEGLVAQARQAEADGFASGWFAHIRVKDDADVVARTRALLVKMARG